MPNNLRAVFFKRFFQRLLILHHHVLKIEGSLHVRNVEDFRHLCHRHIHTETENRSNRCHLGKLIHGSIPF